jgi:hypothetical protein
VKQFAGGRFFAPPVLLETTYRETWDTCPEDMRELVEGG